MADYKKTFENREVQNTQNFWSIELLNLTFEPSLLPKKVSPEIKYKKQHCKTNWSFALHRIWKY